MFTLLLIGIAVYIAYKHHDKITSIVELVKDTDINVTITKKE